MVDTPETDDKKLTRKQQAFIDAYMTNGFNGTRAAIAAGYSEDTARAIAHENLTKPYIRSEIDRLMREYIMPASEVMSRLTDHARGDLGDLYDEDTGQINWKAARKKGLTHLIRKIKHKTTRTTMPDGKDVEIFEDEIELHSVQGALQLIGKYHGQFADRVEVTGKDGGAIILKTGMNMDDL